MRSSLFAACMAVSALGLCLPAAAKGKITSFDPSGSINTFASSINDPGPVAGYYADGSDIYHGFSRAADGTVTTFDPSGSTGTFPFSINTAGAIAGYYHGFIRAVDGAITGYCFDGVKMNYGFVRGK